MLFDKLVETNKAFVFDFDDTLYPEMDYLYQVYYMIAQFIEYHHAIPNEQISKFLISEFEKNGRTHLFDRLIEQFSLSSEYMDNFLRLLRTARLPLKLLLFKESAWILHHLIDHDKKLFLLTNGNPEQQYNKIIQVEWEGIQQHLVCYFANEIKPKPAPDALLKMMDEHQLSANEMVFIGDSDTDKQCAMNASVDYINIKELIASV